MEFGTTKFAIGCLPRNTFSIVLLMLVVLTPFSISKDIHVERCPNQNFDKCYCSSELPRRDQVVKVNCTNTGYNDAESQKALTSIPPTVMSVVFSGNNMRELNPNIFGNGTDLTSCRQMENLVTLDLSRNNITIIHGKAFHCMKTLEILVLDNNNWTVDFHTRVFSSLSKLKTLSLRNAFGGSLRHTGMTSTLKDSFVNSFNENILEEIHLEHNHLKFFDPDLFAGLKNLKRVYFTWNNIAKPEILPSAVRKWEELYLNHNNITSLSSSFLTETMANAQNLKKLDISDNPFHCDCHILHLVQWLRDSEQRHFIEKRDDLTCSSPADKYGRRLVDLTDHELTECPIRNSSKESKVRTSYIILGVIFSILGVLFLAVLYLNRYTIQRKLKVHIVEPVRESIVGRSAHGYASVDNAVRSPTVV